MTKLKLKTGGWIVVCDGSRALILENAGDEKFPNLKTRETYQQDNPPTHAQGTDAPGRSISSVGHGRSSMEQTDWHEQAEREFLRGLAERLDSAVKAHQVSAMIVVAPPRALGVLRQSYSSGLRAVVVEELHKDLVKMPVHEIEKHLLG